LLYPDDEAPPTAAAPADRPALAIPRPSPSPAAQPVTADVSAALRQEIDALQEEMAELHEELAELRRRLDAVENKTAGL